MTDTPGSSKGRAAGWYLDPGDQAVLRWWDGRRWTESTGAAPRQRLTPRPSSEPFAKDGRGEQQAIDQMEERWHRRQAITSHSLAATSQKEDLGEGVGRQPPPPQMNRPHASGASTAPRVPDDEPIANSVLSPPEESQRRGLTTLGLSALFGTAIVVFAAGYALDVGAVRLAGL